MREDDEATDVEPRAEEIASTIRPKRKVTYAELWRVVSMYETSAYENARLLPDPRGEMEHRQACLVRVLELIRLVEKHDKSFRRIIRDAEEATLKKSRGRRDSNQGANDARP